MAKLALEATILHNNLTERDRFEFAADPADNAAIEKRLVEWLVGHGWDKGRWPEFEIVVRPANSGRVLKRLRAPQ